MQNSTQRSLGTRLKEARHRAGLSQEDVAYKVGIHPITVSKHERDVQDPNTAILAELAMLYDVSTDWLITEHENFMFHGIKSHEKVMNLVVSYPYLIVRVRKNTLSERAIEDLKNQVEFVLWREEKRRDRKDRKSGKRLPV